MLAGPSDDDVSGPGGLEVVGFAVTHSGDVYGALDNLGTDEGREGMYTPMLNRTADTAYWQPVKRRGWKPERGGRRFPSMGSPWRQLGG